MTKKQKMSQESKRFMKPYMSALGIHINNLKQTWSKAEIIYMMKECGVLEFTDTGSAETYIVLNKKVE